MTANQLMTDEWWKMQSAIILSPELLNALTNLGIIRSVSLIDLNTWKRSQRDLAESRGGLLLVPIKGLESPKWIEYDRRVILRREKYGLLSPAKSSRREYP